MISVGAAQLLTGLLFGLGLLFLGLWVGLGIREDREADRAAKVALARLQARQAARPPIAYLIPAPPTTSPPTFYRPGYAEAFPRPGRLAVDPGQLAGYITGTAGIDWPAPQLPHGPDLRPTTSPVDLDGAVRLMCLDAELYVANLIAGTYHTERTNE